MKQNRENWSIYALFIVILVYTANNFYLRDYCFKHYCYASRKEVYTITAQNGNCLYYIDIIIIKNILL